MHALRSESLEVSVLDPHTDRERFGTRYCTGGYIFQVTDDRLGELLSGPTYPDSFNTFDGQGIPDAFNQSPLRPAEDPGGPALVIGIGVCDLSANQVLEFSPWEAQIEGATLRLRTRQSLARYALELEREVTVHERTVRSAVRLTNAGRAPIPLRWFPHPFFPQPTTDELCWFSAPLRLGEDAAYEMGANGFVRRRGWPWTEGHYLALDHEAHGNLAVLQRHPLVGMVAATCSYAPSLFPIWGNARTFSWEPYLERTVAVGQALAWHIGYHF